MHVPDTPLTPFAYLWIQHRQRAAFELETVADARVRAARKYQTFLNRARASSVALVVSLAEAIDAQPFVYTRRCGPPQGRPARRLMPTVSGRSAAGCASGCPKQYRRPSCAPMTRRPSAIAGDAGPGTGLELPDFLVR